MPTRRGTSPPVFARVSLSPDGDEPTLVNEDAPGPEPVRLVPSTESSSVVGETVGSVVGEPVGSVVGEPVGSVVGEPVGSVVGEPVGSVVGEPVGSVVGGTVGSVVGGTVLGTGKTWVQTFVTGSMVIDADA